MNDLVSLSIVIPVYNLENFIEKCLSSIQSQLTEKEYPVEVLIVDDGSTDQSKDRILPFLEHKQFRYIYQDNQGVSAARNHGIEQATGTFVLFVDGDDLVSSDYFSVLFSHLTQETELLCFNYKEFSGTVQEIPLQMKNETLTIRPGDGLKGYLQFRYQETIRPFVFNKVYKKAILDEKGLRFDTNKKIGEDTLFNAAYIECIHEMQTIDSVLYYYRIHSSSAIHRYHKDFVHDAIQYYDSFQSIADKLNVSLDMHDLEAFYLSRWFGCINNEAKSSFQKGWKNLKTFLNYDSFILNKKNIRFHDLPNKLKIYDILLSLGMTYPLYVIMYLKNHFSK